MSNLSPISRSRRWVSLLLCSLMALLLTAGASANPAADDIIGPERLVKVYKYDQSTQCNNDGIPLEKMQEELTEAGIRVHCAQKGNDGNAYPAVCGGATGNINIYQIDAGNLPLARRLGFAPVWELENYQDQPCRPEIPKVFKYDGSTQCNDDGIPLHVMAAELRRAGIDVQCSQKARDGLLYPPVCDGPTGIINVYQINPENIPDAMRLGFHPVSRLSEYQDRPCFWTGPVEPE